MTEGCQPRRICRPLTYDKDATKLEAFNAFGSCPRDFREKLGKAGEDIL